MRPGLSHAFLWRLLVTMGLMCCLRERIYNEARLEPTLDFLMVVVRTRLRFRRGA